MTTPFLPTKTEWDHTTAQLNATRLVLGLPDGTDVVPSVQALVRRAAHMEQELAAIRAIFAHLPGPEGESAQEICLRVADLHRRQAETIESLAHQCAESIEVLDDVINQACLGDGGELDSIALSAYASGLRFLAEYGKVKITSEYGRRVIAVPVEFVPEHHGVELPSGAIAHVGPSITPEILAALDEMAKAAIAQAEEESNNANNK